MQLNVDREEENFWPKEQQQFEDFFEAEETGYSSSASSDAYSQDDPLESYR